MHIFWLACRTRTKGFLNTSRVEFHPYIIICRSGDIGILSAFTFLLFCCISSLLSLVRLLSSPCKSIHNVVVFCLYILSVLLPFSSSHHPNSVIIAFHLSFETFESEYMIRYLCQDRVNYR